uniref:ABC transporter ATP-binding protein n=1 Tax=Ignisphaera aggregans TaxID=334771 RepID=A0A7C2VMG0_9CREN
MNREAIRLQNVTYFYPKTSEPALENVTLTVSEGEFLVIAGPSGGGKSTLCKIVTGLIPHLYGGKLAGEAYVYGLNIAEADVKNLVSTVGVVLQNPENQIVNIVVEEELAFALENLLFDRDEIVSRIEEVSRKLGISHILGRSTYELSGGETQKVVLGSILALKPKILVLDEPLAHLDPPTALDLIRFLQYLNKVEGRTIIVVEHRLSELLRCASRLVILDKKIVYDGPPRKAIEDIADVGSVYGIEIPPIAKLGKIMRSTYSPLDVDEALTMLRSSNTVFKTGLPKPVNNEAPDPTCRDVAISVQGLWHIYRNGVVALKDINLEVCRGEFVAIVGGNGSGKTTLVKHFNGLLKPTRGKVLVLGKDVTKHSVAELAQHVGLVFQNPLYYFFRDTVYDEVMFTARSMNVENAEEKVAEILDRLGLSHIAKRSPYEISVGEQRRLAIASALVYNPEILVLDEPTAGIDFKLKMELLEIITSAWREGRTVIITTHDIEFLSHAPVQKVVVLEKGGIVALGNPRRVFYELLPADMEMYLPQTVRLVKRLGVDSAIRPLNIDDLETAP